MLNFWMIMLPRLKRSYAVAVLLTAMLSIQSGAAMAKHLFNALNPYGVTTLRLLFAALILLAIWHPWKKPPRGKEWLVIVLFGASLGLMNMLFYLSIARIPLGIAVALEFTGPLAVALFHSHRRIDWLWIAGALAGIILLSPFNRFSAPLNPAGILYAFGAGICWALYIVFGKKASNSVHGGIATSLGMTAAALIILPIGFINAGTSMFLPAILPTAFCVALLSSAIPYSLEMIGLSNLPTRTFSILMSLEPAVGTVLGFIFLREELNAIQLIAIALVIIASVGSTWSADAAETTTEMTP